MPSAHVICGQHNQIKLKIKTKQNNVLSFGAKLTLMISIFTVLSAYSYIFFFLIFRLTKISTHTHFALFFFVLNLLLERFVFVSSDTCFFVKYIFFHRRRCFVVFILVGNIRSIHCDCCCCYFFTGTEATETETSAIQPLPPLMPQK